ncbi:heparan sulfate glucosamine 3-O-sulfotransferase 1-like [Glandiceps talaboti]
MTILEKINEAIHTNVTDMCDGEIKRSFHDSKDDSCAKRLPQAIVVGAKKCGTGALRAFIRWHPSVIVSEAEEVHYFDLHYDNGIQWYIDQMPFTTSDQVTIEKSPRYFVEPDIPRKIYEDVSPDTKIIIVLCDPIHRAISDYVQVKDRHSENIKRYLEWQKNNTTAEFPSWSYDARRLLQHGYSSHDSFESTVLDRNGNINTDHGVIYVGVYSRHLANWLNYFPRNKILVLDGAEIKNEPAHALQTAEKFLDLQSFFTDDKFYFNETKGFYCLSKPISYCLPSDKGRPHPQIKEDVVVKLKDYFKPSNEQVQIMLNQTFSWISK